MDRAKRIRSIISATLVLALCLTLLPVQALAEEPTVTKQDISGAIVEVADQEFFGIPVYPEVKVTLNGKTLTAETDYTLLFENDINIGTATVRVVGNGNYYGSVTKDFSIVMGNTDVSLKGTYIGQYGGDTSGDYYYEEGYLSPGIFTGYIDASQYHQAYYALYRLEGEEPILVAELETQYSNSANTYFSYDFSSVYENAADEGGEIYLLYYTWVQADYGIYTGILAMIIPAKVADATSISLEQAADGDFRADYFAAYGDDGNQGDITWTSSDTSVATVDDGVVTLLKPGTFTVTAQYGELTASQQITVSALDITQAAITGYSSQDNTASVIYDGRLLTAGTDYTVQIATKDDVTEVTVTGCDLFTGQLVRQYNAQTGQALDHSHGFTYVCDTTCGSCTFTRTTTHQLSEQWSKDLDGHWHECGICGEKPDLESHDISTDDPTWCNTCGTLYIPGDLDGNMVVNRNDVTQLLLHISMADTFPLSAPADFNGDDAVDRNDAILLLLHVSDPDTFPLQA